MSGLSEFELIDQLLKPLAQGAPGAFALTDDAAILPDLAQGHVHVVTKDALAVGIHMLETTSPQNMARKALRVNLSDLASMGATPVAFFMALCLGEETDEAFLRNFVCGLAEDVSTFSMPLIGGDIIRQSGAFTVTLTAIGTTPKDKVLRRSGAKAGDGLWVTGTVGDGALGLLAARGELSTLSRENTNALAERYEIPKPRIELGEVLRDIASACVDISDGLVADVEHVCSASSVSCTIDTTLVPLSEAALSAVSDNPSLRKAVLTGGDDYELAFAVPRDKEPDLEKAAARLNTQVTRIGAFKEGTEVLLRDQTGNLKTIAGTGYRHI